MAVGGISGSNDSPGMQLQRNKSSMLKRSVLPPIRQSRDSGNNKLSAVDRNSRNNFHGPLVPLRSRFFSSNRRHPMDRRRYRPCRRHPVERNLDHRLENQSETARPTRRPILALSPRQIRSPARILPQRPGTRLSPKSLPTPDLLHLPGPLRLSASGGRREEGSPQRMRFGEAAEDLGLSHRNRVTGIRNIMLPPGRNAL